MGEMTWIESSAGPTACYVARPDGGAKAESPGVLVLHAWWGLTDHFKGVCDRLAKNGYVAVAPDMFGGKTADTSERAEQLVKSSNAKDSLTIVKEALDHLKGLAPAKTGVVGFSFGGYFVIWLAIERPGDVHALVPFYADHDLDVSTVEAAQQWHFAEKDEFVPEEWLAEFREKVTGLGRSDIELYDYPGTEHAFFNVSRPEAYKKEAAELAWERMLTFFGTYLG